MQVVPKEMSDGSNLVSQVVSAMLDAPEPEPLSPDLAPPPIPAGLTPRQQLFAYVMACGAPSIRAIGTLAMRMAVAVLVLVVAGLLAWGALAAKP
jgi:hypothetical protein